MRHRRDWAIEKVGMVTSSMMEMRNKVESEANRLNIRPEKFLMDSIRHTSAKLNENMEKFREKTTKVIKITVFEHLKRAR